MEILLILLVFLLFMVTDSRTIKYIAQTSLDPSIVAYESIEGNLFKGLSIRNLKYKDKPLFSSAVIYWNPLTLLSNKVTITQLDAQGIELDNILYMIDELGSAQTEGNGSLNLSFAVNNTHFDINPYLYEGVKFASFVLESGKIEVDESLKINTGPLYLKFDSDIVNVKLNGTIEESNLLIDELELKNISSKEIGPFISRIRKGNAKEAEVDDSDENFMPIKKIKVKHILATLKAVQYGDFKIRTAQLNLYDGTVDPLDNFEYQVKVLALKGKTNFGLLNYKGYVKDSMVYAQGEIGLDKSLFNRYKLPLKFNNFKRLPSKLRLNHDAVWVDIEHKAKELLDLKSDFNVNLTKAEHKLHYDYKGETFTAISSLRGEMPYAKLFQIENRLLIEKKAELSYEGSVNVSKLRALPTLITEYLMPEVEGNFKGNVNSFEMGIESNLLTGQLSMPKYEHGLLDLKSKAQNIALNKLINNLPLAFEKKYLAFNSQSSFNFQDLTQSKVAIQAETDTLNIDADMKIEKPYKIDFITALKDEKDLEQIAPNVNFSNFRNLQGSVVLKENDYDINLKNNNLNVSLQYDSLNSILQKGVITIANETFTLNSVNNNLELKGKVENLQNFLDNLKNYYRTDFPNLQGSLVVNLKQEADGNLLITLQSPNIKYLSDTGVNLSVTNIYHLDIVVKIDKAFNIDLKHYEFKIDDNGYLNIFYATKNSHMRLNENLLTIQKFWLNDNALVSGSYDISRLEGALKLESEAFRLRTKDFDLSFNAQLDINLQQEKIDVNGEIEILGNTITYELEGSDIVEDSDIVIMKEMLQREESPLKNLKFYLKVNNKNPLKYIGEDVNIEFLNQLSILKNFNQEILVTGMTNITKGYYQVEDKYFMLDKSQLYFTGDMTKPLLDIKADYEKDAYKVHLFISGTTEAPIVNFTSEPYLTEQEIMSLILFDGTGSSSGTGAEAYTLLGGMFAKGLIKSLGIDVDHLLLGQDAQDELSLEVGKKISNDISVLYLHKDGLDGVKVRVEHSNSFETDIIIQPPNTSSIEFLYKQDR